MTTTKTVCDVFIAYDDRNYDTAKLAADALRSRGLVVQFDLPEHYGSGASEDATWDAIAESQAMVIVIPEELSLARLGIEVGAAKSWNKPIYAVSTFSHHGNLPSFLRDVPIYPINRIDELALAISQSAEALNEAEVEHLKAAYVKVGTPTDQLALQPQKLRQLVGEFTRSSGRRLAGEQVLSYLLRLRKQGSLPRLKKTA